MSEWLLPEREDGLRGDAHSMHELSEAEVARECGSVLPERALMRKKLPGQTFHVDLSAYDPQLAASDPYYVPRGTFGLP